MKKIGFYSAVCFILIGCGGGGSSASTTTTNTSGNINDPVITTQAFDAPAIEDNIKQEYLDVINAARSVEQDCGTKGIKPAADPLIWNDKLYSAAYEHSEDMVESNTFSHNGSGTNSDWTAKILSLSDGSTFPLFVPSHGFVYPVDSKTIVPHWL